MAITRPTGNATVVDIMDAMIDNAVRLVNIEMAQGMADFFLFKNFEFKNYRGKIDTFWIQ